jgi:tRNA(Ile)-lysidine synthase
MRDARPQLRWAQEYFRAGERVAVAVSGGADSVALLLAMATSRPESGIVLSAIHVHHGLRGAEADEDAAFVEELAGRLDVPLHVARGDTAALAAERGQGVEEAARTLRYGVFRMRLASRAIDAVATAHTLDDQAETVLMKLLRGAWTEGLGGIAPAVSGTAGGRIVRPLLGVTRAEVVAYLQAAGQPWREDSSNQDPAFARNRIRHTLLPQLREYAPNALEQLARLATVARDEEAWWARELGRTLPGLILPGKPVRGGGRANSTQPGEAAIAIEVDRLTTLHPALERRVLRAAAEQLGVPIGFAHTEALRELARSAPGTGKRGRLELSHGLVAERTARELRLSRAAGIEAEASAPTLPELVVPVPGRIEALQYGLRVEAEGSLPSEAPLLLRTPRPGDRVLLRHSRSAKTVKDVLERGGWSAADRARWPVLAAGKQIVWMRGVDVEPDLQLRLRVRSLDPLLAEAVSEQSSGPLFEPVPRRAPDPS